jgi:hypothetical protein
VQDEYLSLALLLGLRLLPSLLELVQMAGDAPHMCAAPAARRPSSVDLRLEGAVLQLFVLHPVPHLLLPASLALLVLVNPTPATLQRGAARPLHHDSYSSPQLGKNEASTTMVQSCTG